MDYRAVTLAAIIDKTGLEEPYAKDLEIGIFNWFQISHIDLL